MRTSRAFLLFQLIFYPGSWVRREAYHPLLQSFTRISNQTTIPFAPYHGLTALLPSSSRAENKSNSNIMNDEKKILIGHSMGGYLALLDTIKNPDEVAGVILFNSHFNSRGTMPYPSLALRDIPVPVLTILGARDRRLPLSRGLDDLLEAIQDYRRDKFFLVDPEGGHMPSRNPSETVLTAIELFLKDDLQTLTRVCEPLRDRFTFPIADLSRNPIITSQSSNILDELLRITMPQWMWRHAHLLWFLSSRSTRDLHFLHEQDDHVLWKGSPDDHERIRALLPNTTRLLTFSLPSWHPSIMAWLSLPLFPRLDEEGHPTIPVLVLPVDKERTYYKIPHPSRLAKMLLTRELISSIKDDH